MRAREGRANLVVGAVAIGCGLATLLFTTMIAYGGVWQMPLPERLLFLSPAIGSFVVGAVFMSMGLYRVACRQRA